MAVIGIDLGLLNSKIAVARNRGIDILVNETSNRATPSVISLNPDRRYIGESGKTLQISNFKNTFGSMFHLLGHKLLDDNLTEFEGGELLQLQNILGVSAHGKNFTVTQMVAMFLNKLQNIVETEMGVKIGYLVINTPCYFTQLHRIRLLDACYIANLNCVKLINDTTSAALTYGITKTDLDRRNVILIDIGYSKYTVSGVVYDKGKLEVKYTGFDNNVGGKFIDRDLAMHYCNLIKEKYKIDVLSNKKAMYRLLMGCEKTKKILSANNQAPLNVECIMNDVDISFMLQREEFEQIIQAQVDKLAKPIQDLIQHTQWSTNDIHSIEIIGGSSRIPAFKNEISKIFNNEIKLSFTLNQDEAIARGCALQCAILSPVFKVRDFSVVDISLFPIEFQWLSQENKINKIEVFKKNSQTPSIKQLTFYKKSAFDIDIYYSQNKGLPSYVDPFIATYNIEIDASKFEDKNIEMENDLCVIRVKTKINLHGIVEIYSAYVVEEIIIEDTIKPEDAEAEKEENKEEPKEKKVKKTTKKHELVVTKIKSDDTLKQDLEKYLEIENEMLANDKLALDTEHARNSVEEYVYDTRAKLGGIYSDFADLGVKNDLTKQLDDVENWLYEDGENQSKGVYVEKLTTLKKIGEPIANRYLESQTRNQAFNQLEKNINNYMKILNTNEEAFSHLSVEDKQKIGNKCSETLKWMSESKEKLDKQEKFKDPQISTYEIVKMTKVTTY